jgi:hypothetical protein
MKLNVLLGHALSLFLAAGRRRPTEISAAVLRENQQRTRTRDTQQTAR